MRVSLGQDLVQHKFWGQDGASIEGTGRAPLVFTATIPFRNGIVPGKNERWGILYPEEYRKFVVAGSERGTGTLTHPEFGEVKCRLERCETEWSAERRDGCDVEATWVEDRIDELDSVNLHDASPVQQADLAALDLDAQLTSLTPKPELPEYKSDFGDFMRGVTAISDQATLLQTKAGGKIDQIAFRAGQLGNSLQKLQTRTAQTVRELLHPDQSLAGRVAMSWPMRQSTERLKSATRDLRKTILASGKPIVFYRVPKDTTLAAIAIDTGAPLSDLMRLNPSALRSASVPEGSLIRHYA